MAFFNVSHDLSFPMLGSRLHYTRLPNAAEREEIERGKQESLSQRRRSTASQSEWR